MSVRYTVCSELRDGCQQCLSATQVSQLSSIVLGNSCGIFNAPGHEEASRIETQAQESTLSPADFPFGISHRNFLPFAPVSSHSEQSFQSPWSSTKIDSGSGTKQPWKLILVVHHGYIFRGRWQFHYYDVSFLRYSLDKCLGYYRWTCAPNWGVK